MRRLLLFLVLSATLVLLLAQANRLWLPPWLQPLGHALYRPAFFLTVPAETVTMQFSAPVGHHIPARNMVVDSVVTSALLMVAWAWARRRMNRRRWIFIGAVSSPLLALAVWGMWVEPGRLQVRSYTVPIRDLPEWAEGLTLVHVSDTHYGPYVTIPYLERVVRTVNALQPDLVVLTGDYTHRTPASIERGIGVFAPLRGRLGVVGVLGNHDHWEGADACRSAFADASILLLDGRAVYLRRQGISDEPGDDPLVIAGLGDMWEQPTPLETVLEGIPASLPRVVLSHNPDTAQDLPAASRRVHGQWVREQTSWRVDPTVRVDLMLSGHTHGGQIWITSLGTPLLPISAGAVFAGGLVQGPYFPVLISRGVGMAFLPVRLGVPPEIGWVTLVRG